MINDAQDKVIIVDGLVLGLLGKALTIILEKLGATFIPGRVSAISQVASHVELQSDLGTDETRSFDLCVIASRAMRSFFSIA